MIPFCQEQLALIRVLKGTDDDKIDLIEYNKTLLKVKDPFLNRLISCYGAITLKYSKKAYENDLSNT